MAKGYLILTDSRQKQKFFKVQYLFMYAKLTKKYWSKSHSAWKTVKFWQSYECL